MVYSTPLMSPRQRASAYAGLALMQIRTLLVYRADFFIRVLRLLLQIYLLRVLWTAVYPASGDAATGEGRHVDLATQIAYATLASVLSWITSPWGLGVIPQRVRDGTVALDLARPVRFTSHMLASQAGITLALIPFALFAFPFAVLVGGAVAPASGSATLAFTVSLVFSYVNSLLMGAIVSMMSFWTLEVSGVFTVYQTVGQFFAGTLVPLWFMPGWLADLARVLPFQTTVYIPTALYLGQFNTATDVLTELGLQCVWAVTLWIILQFLWSRALRRIVIQGG